jgi:putative phosphoribosyl transferase
MLFREEDENEEILPFADRADAGRILASKLSAYSGRGDVVVVGIARGGMSVAFEVARLLHAPLDVLVVRKLGSPLNKELAWGAVAGGGVWAFDTSIVRELSLTDKDVQAIVDAEVRALHRRERIYRSDHRALPVAGRTVILVDDGIATGNSVLAAIRSLRRQRAARVVVATPMLAASCGYAIRMEADEVVCVAELEMLLAISQCYEDFSEVSDSDVCSLLVEASRFAPLAA